MGPPAGDQAYDAHGRPTRLLPRIQLVRLSLYWFGLSSIFAGLAPILSGRLEFQRLVPPGQEGQALLAMTAGGAVIAMLVQPTVGTISDYTTSRWGRRKPYILVGTLLDLVFLAGIATSNTVLAIAAFVILLQFSSNLAQGPFQGYVPDLVPGPQVGLASALVGLMQVLGNAAGFAIGALAIATDQFAIATIALGLVELLTMVSVFLWVDEGRTPKARAGRSWPSIAREAWGTDILGERSFIWLVASRLLVLMGGAVLVNLATFYLSRSHGLDQAATGTTFLTVSVLISAMVAVSVVPAARTSDRFGRKPVIYAACGLGAVGLGVAAVAPTIPVALVGVTLFGVSAGAFLAVDWALMTDIIPKASSGRYMGISNVATASAGILAIAIGGTLMDLVGGAERAGSGPRAALVFGVACFLLGAALLRPVDPRRREDAPVPAVQALGGELGSPADA